MSVHPLDQYLATRAAQQPRQLSELQANAAPQVQDVRTDSDRLEEIAVELEAIRRGMSTWFRDLAILAWSVAGAAWMYRHW